jgi:hypothetical protein
MDIGVYNILQGGVVCYFALLYNNYQYCIIIDQCMIIRKIYTKKWGVTTSMCEILPAINGWASYVDTNLSKDACMTA